MNVNSHRRAVSREGACSQITKVDSKGKMSTSEAHTELFSQYVTGRFSVLGYVHAAPCQKMSAGFKTGSIKLASLFS